MNLLPVKVDRLPENLQVLWISMLTLVTVFTRASLLVLYNKGTSKLARGNTGILLHLMFVLDSKYYDYYNIYGAYFEG